MSKSHSTHLAVLKNANLTMDSIPIESFLQEISRPDGIINLSSLKKMGGGGTHDIYQSEKNPKLLLKVMKHTVGKDKVELSQHLHKLDGQYSLLYDIFGRSRCIIEKRSIQSIQLNNLEQSAQKAIVSVVPFDSCFKSEEKFGFNVKPVEMDGKLITAKRYLYEKANRSLLSKYEKPNAYVMRNYPALNQEFEKIFKLLDTEKSLAPAMQEFLTKYKGFYQKTGILLDTIGFDNVLFYKSNGMWQFKLGSVIKHDTGALTKKNLAEISINPNVVNESPESFTSIFYMPACIRALNACAEKLRMDKIIEDITIDQKTIDALAEMHTQLGEAHRILNFAEHGDFATTLNLYHQYITTEKSHDTRLRDMMGTLYWDFIKNGGKENSKAEVETYIAILGDSRNQFPDFREKIVEDAIKGLKGKIQSLDSSLSNQSFFSKTEVSPCDKPKIEKTSIFKHKGN